MRVYLMPRWQQDGMTVTVQVKAGDSVLAPRGPDGQSVRTGNFHDNFLQTEIWWGDGTHIVNPAPAGRTCRGATELATGMSLRQVGQPHTYAQPGEYRFSYRVTYCSPDGPWTWSEGATITVLDPEK